MLIDPLTDADCMCLQTLAITAHRPCCVTRTDHLTKVVQTLYLVYIPPMRWVVLRLPTCAFYQVSVQTWIPLLLPSSSSSTPPWYSSPSSSSPISSVTYPPTPSQSTRQ